MEIVQVRLELEPEAFEKLWRHASNRINFLRSNPRKAWTKQEKKECIRLFMIDQASSAVVRYDDERRE